jgi:catechol 2,3-dioxygenase
MSIQRTGHVALRVRDLEAARHFYGDILGMRIGEERPGRAIFFRFNDYHHDIVVFKAADGAGPASEQHAGAAYRFRR